MNVAGTVLGGYEMGVLPRGVSVNKRTSNAAVLAEGSRKERIRKPQEVHHLVPDQMKS